jgi:hypothetical protein
MSLANPINPNDTVTVVFDGTPANSIVGTLIAFTNRGEGSFWIQIENTNDVILVRDYWYLLKEAI